MDNPRSYKSVLCHILEFVPHFFRLSQRTMGVEILAMRCRISFLTFARTRLDGKRRDFLAEGQGQQGTNFSTVAFLGFKSSIEEGRAVLKDG